MPQGIYKGIDDTELREVANKVWSYNYSALQSPSRKELEKKIKASRLRSYALKIEPGVSAPQDLSNINVPSSMTDVRGYVARFVNILVNSFPMATIDDDKMKIDLRTMLQEKFTKILLNKVNIAGYFSDYLKTLFIDGIVGTKVTKDKTYQSIKVERTVQEWITHPEFKKTFKAILESQYTPEEFNQLSPNEIIPLVYPQDVEITTNKYYTLDDLIFPEDMEEREQDKAEFITIRKQMKLDAIYRETKQKRWNQEAYNEIKTHYDKGGYQKDDYALEDYSVSLDTTMAGTISKKQTPCEIWECYFYYDINHDDYDELCIMELERYSKQVFKFDIYDDIERPINIDAFDTETKQIITARSYVYYISPIHDVINEFTNSNIDNARLQAGVSGSYRVGSGFDPDEHVIGNHTMIPRQSAGDIDIFKFPEIGQSSVAIHQMMNSYKQTFSGLLDQTVPSGANVLKHRTFRGIASVISQGNIMIEYILNMIKPKLNKILTNLFKYIMDLDGINVLVNSNILNVMKEVKRENAEFLAQFMMALPQIQQNPKSVYLIAKKVWESTGEPGFSEIFPEPQAQQPQIQMPGQTEMPMHRMPDGTMMPGLAHGAQPPQTGAPAAFQVPAQRPGMMPAAAEEAISGMQ